MKKTINIMTSCDDNYSRYILPQLVSANRHMGKFDVHFYLLHTTISDENIKLISDFIETLDAITFHEIKVTDVRRYDKLVKYGDSRTAHKKGLLWPPELYYWMFIHEYLPKDVERVLKFDAGDVLFIGDIEEYYFKDFEDKMIMASARLLITEGEKTRYITKKDIDDKDLYGQLLGSGQFCPGCIVLNVPKFREIVTKNIYDDYIDVIKKKFPNAECLYLGDQGLFSVLFADYIGYFMRPDIMDVWYRPYNFPVGNFFEREKEDFDYKINVIHFNSGKIYKPWVARFTAEDIKKYDLRVDGAAGPAPFVATPTIIEYYEMWWDFCKETPIYESINYTAVIAAEVLQKDFLYLCQEYNKLYTNNKNQEKINQQLSELLNLLTEHKRI